MKLGPGELILIIAIILIVTGASFAPKLARMLGRGVRKAREGLSPVAEQSIGDKKPPSDDV